MKTNKLFIAAGLLVMLTACNTDDYKYDPERVDTFEKELYAQNFKNKFLEIVGTSIDSNQSWDFSGEPLTSISSLNSRATRAATNFIDHNYPGLDEDGYYRIPISTQKSLNAIKENKDNHLLANTYAMSLTESNFSIIPIRQGQTGSTYEVHMVVGYGDNAQDYLLWKKNELMQYRNNSKDAWKELTNPQKSDEYNYTSYNKYEIRSQVLTFKNMPVGEPVFFYLYRPTTGLYPSSLEGFMKDFTNVITVPEQLVSDGKQIKVIGVEAQRDKVWVDNDFEDVMFMLVGDPTLPEDITKIDDMNFKQTFTKRYMIEDLGDADDTDFNDIVVDVTSSRTISFTQNPETGQITDRTYGEWGDQKAVIRHLGGVLPFQLKIGTTTFDWMEGKMNVNPNSEYAVAGWNPDANNISITVKMAMDAEHSHNITFPTNGTVPLIIATSPEQEWMAERSSIIPKLKELILPQEGE